VRGLELWLRRPKCVGRLVTVVDLDNSRFLGRKRGHTTLFRKSEFTCMHIRSCPRKGELVSDAAQFRWAAAQNKEFSDPVVIFVDASVLGVRSPQTVFSRNVHDFDLVYTKFYGCRLELRRMIRHLGGIGHREGGRRNARHWVTDANGAQQRFHSFFPVMVPFVENHIR
jgi:hypothetical protein